jgi:pheromone shutdown protein TraB
MSHEPQADGASARDASIPGDRPPVVPLEASAPAGPTAVVERGGVTFTLLGTAHVSPASAAEVEAAVASGRFDAVAVELDAGRYAAISDPGSYAKVDLFQVLRSGKMGMLALSLALGAFQQRLAEQLGIEPGQEFRAAIAGAKAAGVPLLLIDRDLGVTLRRVQANVPWWQRLTLMAGVVASVLSREQVDADEIEKLKQGDVLEATFAEFAENEQALYLPLIAERDRYMVGQLERQVLRAPREGRPKEVLVVIGAGHLAGMTRELAAADGVVLVSPATQGGPPGAAAGRAGGAGPNAGGPGPTTGGAGPNAGGAADAAVAAADDLARLEATPPPAPLTRALPWLLVALVLFGFYLGFQRNPDLGWRLLAEWAIINGGLAGLGAAIALAHPLTVLGTAAAAPFTSLNPMIGAGFVAAGLELWLRKPSVGDFQSLRRDVTTLGGWWRNRAARTFVVFVLATLGSVIGTYLGGFRILEGLLR